MSNIELYFEMLYIFQLIVVVLAVLETILQFYQYRYVQHMYDVVSSKDQIHEKVNS